MEGKVLLYDANDVKIGETFMRRARQLVKQQRASWIDDEREAIKFAPGLEDSEVGIFEAQPAVSRIEGDEKWLIALAEKRLFKRKMFRWHTILLLPVAFFLFIICAGILDAAFGAQGAMFFLGGSWGSWLTAYAIHTYFYTQTKSRSASKSQRIANELAAEVALLKHELGSR